MTATLTTANGILKEVYEGTVTDQLQHDAIAIKRITRSSEGIFDTPGGKYVVFPLHTKRNSGISYRAENTQLGAAGRQGYQQAQETLKYGYGRIKITGQAMALAKTNPQSFINVLDGEMEGIKKDLTKDSNRIAWGNPGGWAATGGTGVIARTTAGSAASTTITAPTRQLDVGMVLDVVDNAGVGVVGATGRTIVSITSATAFVVDAAVTIALGDNIVRAGNWNMEPYGFSNIVSQTGILHNINPATPGNEYWRAAVDDAATAVLTELAMIKMADEIKMAGGSAPTVIFASLGVRRVYWNLLTSLRRYNEPKEWTGGLVGLAFMHEKEIPVVTDMDAPLGSMYMITEPEITVYRDREWYFEDTDGSVLKYVHDFDVFEALMKQYWQIVTHKRNAHGRFTILTEV